MKDTEETFANLLQIKFMDEGQKCLVTTDFLVIMSEKSFSRHHELQAALFVVCAEIYISPAYPHLPTLLLGDNRK